MNKTALLTSISLLAIALATPLGAATHNSCTGVVTAISAGAETLYVDDRSQGAVTINHWIYLESNDEEGLQSGGTAPYPENPVIFGEDPCDHSNPDTIIF